MQMKAFNWKRSQPLAQDYIDSASPSMSLFDYNHLNPADWLDRSKFLITNEAPKADREVLVKALSAYNRKAGNSTLALHHIEQLLDVSTLTVVGGQQAGLFGGQLFVIYKAITLIQLARKWSDELKCPVIPIFWIAGEDHDFDEVNHIHYVSSDLQVEKIKVDHPTGKRTSVSKLPLLAETWQQALHSLDDSLMDTEFKSALLARLKHLTKPDTTLTDSFAALMASLFSEYGLVLLDSDDAALRQVEASMFKMLIERNEELSESLLHGKQNVEAAGYIPQAEILESGAHLFIFEGEQRLLLQRDGNLFNDKRKEYSYSKEQLLEIAETAPQRLSNNVMTRPLMQEFLFPVLATVLGPGEISYWGLTQKAFHLFGMKMPIIAPRLEFTLVEGGIQKHMGKYNLTLEDIRFRFEEKQQEWLESQDTMQLSERFNQVKESFRESYEPLVESLGAIQSGMQQLGKTNLAKIMEQIDYLEGKAADAYKAQFDASLRQLNRLKLSIVPLAKPQERVYNIHTYLNRYGDGWLKQLIETQIPIDGMHRVYYL